ncbi:MAG: heme-binding domain-containing protein [Candidatus Zixiibacteriota bacterium]
MAKRRSIVIGVLAIVFIAFIVIQFIPAGDLTNPPITGSPNWDSPQTEQLVRRVCFDCHSNETRWPWYASIAPVSWRLQEHVEHGRKHLNFSEFDKLQRRAPEAAVEVAEGRMPPWDYKLMHPEARLSEAETQALINGLRATFGDLPRPKPDDD